MFLFKWFLLLFDHETVHIGFKFHSVVYIIMDWIFNFKLFLTFDWSRLIIPFYYTFKLNWFIFSCLCSIKCAKIWFFHIIFSLFFSFSSSIIMFLFCVPYSVVFGWNYSYTEYFQCECIELKYAVKSVWNVSTETIKIDFNLKIVVVNCYAIHYILKIDWILFSLTNSQFELNNNLIHKLI